MGRCFVIQPFDKGPFDKRYEDVFAPAISAVGLEPYRVDRDPGASIPIEQIETGIRNSDVCLADITTDNPNVWFELGFAIASRKEVILVCSEERKPRFPFDVQHRNIITYSTDSPRDFEALRDRITKRVKAIMAKEVQLGAVASMSPIADYEGLTQHEMVALVAIAQNINRPNEAISSYTVRSDMNKAGFTRVAATLGLAALVKKRLIEAHELFDDQREEPYAAYALTDDGMAWLMNNQDRLALRETSKEPGDAAKLDVPF